MLMVILLLYSASGITSGKQFVASSKWRPFWKFWNIKHSFNLTSAMRRSSQIIAKIFFMVMTSSMTSHGDPEVALYIYVWERLAPAASCKGNVSSIHVNIVIVFRGYTCLKEISINNTFFRERKSRVNVTGLLGDLGTSTAVTPSILRFSRCNKNWNVRNSYSYVATATKIRFHFQFPRYPDAAFGGYIGWLLN